MARLAWETPDLKGVLAAICCALHPAPTDDAAHKGAQVAAEALLLAIGEDDGCWTVGTLENIIAALEDAGTPPPWMQRPQMGDFKNGYLDVFKGFRRALGLPERNDDARPTSRLPERARCP